mmetsp:Transcript_18868/g.47956  ORF Transcript_18868/g.47956 Transcript_18868/m.47956 type:complete len:214 (+) Transcript_18868:109-750(+)
MYKANTTYCFNAYRRELDIFNKNTNKQGMKERHHHRKGICPARCLHCLNIQRETGSVSGLGALNTSREEVLAELSLSPLERLLPFSTEPGGVKLVLLSPFSTTTSIFEETGLIALTPCPFSLSCPDDPKFTSPGPATERRTGRKSIPCRIPRAMVRKNIRKKMKKIYEFENPSTSTATNVENAPWKTELPIFFKAKTILSFLLPLAIMNEWAI